MRDDLRGDGPCQDCGTRDNIIWHTDNDLWNYVMNWPVIVKDTDDPGGILCIPCFVTRAATAGIRPVWKLTYG